MRYGKWSRSRHGRFQLDWTTEPLQVRLRLLMENAVRITGYEPRKIDARILPQLLRSFFLRLLLATILRQPQAAFAGNVKHFVHPGEIWITGIDFLAAFDRRDISLLQLKVVLRNFEIVQGVFLQIRIANSRGVRTRLRPALTI